MAAKASWYKYGTKLCHCHATYRRRRLVEMSMGTISLPSRYSFLCLPPFSVPFSPFPIAAFSYYIFSTTFPFFPPHFYLPFNCLSSFLSPPFRSPINPSGGLAGNLPTRRLWGRSRPHRVGASLLLKIKACHMGVNRGKSGPALGGTEYRLMPSACRLIVRAKL